MNSSCRPLMADTYDSATRSEVMRRVKGLNTKPEMLLRKAMFAIGLRGGDATAATCPGKPDIGLRQSAPSHLRRRRFLARPPLQYWRGRRGDYWDNKIERNIGTRPRRKRTTHRTRWNVIRLWDFEVEADPQEAAVRVNQALQRIQHGGHVAQTHNLALAESPPLETKLGWISIRHEDPPFGSAHHQFK